MSYYKENAWWASPFNEVAEVISKSKPKQKVEIHDATLRDGEQTPGVVFSKEDKIRIADKLVELGITRIEAGMPAVSKSDFEAIYEIAKKHDDAKIFTVVRTIKEEIDQASDCGSYGIYLDIPIGYPKLQYQFKKWTWKDVYEKFVESIEYAHSKGLHVALSQYDTTRARPDDLVNLDEAITKNCPPDSICIVDTVGCALPATIDYMVRKIKKITNGMTVEVHTHNDFGLAVATELAGMAAGAEILHCCVNGLGERTGNAALEELIICMKILLGMDIPYKLERMQELCDLVEEISGIPIAPNKPFAGRRNYTRESGMGVNLVVNQPLAMFATDPRYFGKKGNIVLGKMSGKASVLFYLDKLDMNIPTDEVIPEIVLKVKEFGMEKKRLLTEDEFVKIVQKYI